MWRGWIALFTVKVTVKVHILQKNYSHILWIAEPFTAELVCIVISHSVQKLFKIKVTISVYILCVPPSFYQSWTHDVGVLPPLVITSWSVRVSTFVDGVNFVDGINIFLLLSTALLGTVFTFQYTKAWYAICKRFFCHPFKSPAFSFALLFQTRYDDIPSSFRWGQEVVAWCNGWQGACESVSVLLSVCLSLSGCLSLPWEEGGGGRLKWLKALSCLLITSWAVTILIQLLNCNA